MVSVMSRELVPQLTHSPAVIRESLARPTCDVAIRSRAEDMPLWSHLRTSKHRAGTSKYHRIYQYALRGEESLCISHAT
jgi:hypothetical protein